MSAMPSAPWSTSLRVAAWMGWPGTVKSLMRSETSPSFARNVSGKRSKKSVRSSCVSRVIRRPRASAPAWPCSATRFVVLPLSAGP